MNYPTAEEIMREPIEWTRSWVPNSDKSELDMPRVLLIGDSIVMGYGPQASECLKGEVSLAWVGTSRFPSDSFYYEQIALVLRSTRFDAIHFHLGMHGLRYDEVAYATHLTRVVEQLRAVTPQAAWMLANSTPKRDTKNLDEYAAVNDRVLVRNQAMAALARELDLPMTDLYQAMDGHPEYYAADGSHFNEAGITAQGEWIASSVRRLIAQ